MADSTDAAEMLNTKQQPLIMWYSADWDVIAYEHAIRGARESDRIRKFVDIVDCLTYSPLKKK